MKLLPSSRLLAIGIVLLVTLGICSRSITIPGGPTFLVLSGIAGLAYLLALRELHCTAKLSRKIVVFGLALAAVWHLLFLFMPPGADDDIHHYVWDGRLQRRGYNPYFVSPDNPAVAPLRTSETGNLNNPSFPTIYPPAAELFFRAVSSLHESVFAMKAAFFICAWAIIPLLFVLLRIHGRGEHWILAYAWNPLLAIEATGSGHVDIVGVLLLIMSIVALERRWRKTAVSALALAICVKPLPLVLLPLYWKRVRIRDAVLGMAVIAFLYGLFIDYGRIPTGALGAFVRVFRFNDLIFSALTRIASPQIVAGIAVGVGFVTAIWFQRRSATLSSSAIAWPMALSLLCAPVVYPWYLLWLLPFLGSVASFPLAVWSISILPTLIVWHLRLQGRPWLVPGWVMLLEYGCVAAAVAWTLFRQRTGRPDLSGDSKTNR